MAIDDIGQGTAVSDVSAGATGGRSAAHARGGPGPEASDATEAQSDLIELVGSRTGLAALGTAAFWSVATFAWWVPAPASLRAAAVVPALFGAGLAWRWLRPMRAQRVVDARGITWSIGRQPATPIGWNVIHGIRRNEDDHGFPPADRARLGAAHPHGVPAGGAAARRLSCADRAGATRPRRSAVALVSPIEG